ncbi:restriction endonuclease subunit S [Pseudomonas chengduensis]|jgi:type I restriction enzyme S subunit|nr:restriction endonuclease subunit S [Pseudomonas chengduensis]MBG0846540.1 restriction endonuclease subunit S [Pseudomonas chengduensis]
MAPESWKTTTLNEIAEVIDCKHRTPGYVDQGIPVVSPGSIRWGELDLISPTKRVTYTDFISLMDHCTVAAGDLVMSRNQSVGIASFVNTESTFVLGQDTVLIKPLEINSKFLYYQLQNPTTQKEIRKLSGGSTFSRINLHDLRTIKIAAPQNPEQIKIAQILSTWDKAISTTERLLASSQQQKQVLAQDLLTGRKRHRELSGTWKSYRLGDLFERITQKNTEGNTNVVTISAQHGLIRQDEFFKKTVASATLEGYYLLNQGQFAYNKSYSNGYPMGAIKRLNRYEKGVVTTLYICFAVRDKANCCPVFFEQFFDAGLLNEGLAQIAHEGGRAHGLLNVKPADFFSLKVQVPSLEEQHKIAQVLSTADAEITNLQAQLDKLKLEKKALMQQLLTGKRRVRLDDDEKDAAPIRRVG